MYAVVFHAHQKIDRVAARLLDNLQSPGIDFPDLSLILHFEGKRGPDATRLKKDPGTEQPWHFIDPFDESDDSLVHTIADHYQRLVKALATHDKERAAFEAAWLGHALVDGLTPAHHYPYEQELAVLHGNERAARTKLREKFVVRGDSWHDSVRRSFRIIGPGGLLTTHMMFEAGAYSIIQPLRLSKALPQLADIDAVEEHGLPNYFLEQARQVGSLGIFVQFLETGWTPKLARLVRRELAPRMVRTVTLAWYCAQLDAKRFGQKQ